MRTVYACTHITKEASEDRYEHGCEMTRNCVMSESCHITAPTLEKLIGRIGNYYCLDIDDVFIPGDEDEGITHVGYDRLETNDGYEPSKKEIESWKRGELTLYLADYTFMIEKRETCAVSMAEFEAARIKTH